MVAMMTDVNCSSLGVAVVCVVLVTVCYCTCSCSSESQIVKNALDDCYILCICGLVNLSRPNVHVYVGDGKIIFTALSL
jgi:uncharacterized membrane protein